MCCFWSVGGTGKERWQGSSSEGSRLKRSYDMGRVQCVVVVLFFFGGGANDILLALLHW